MPKAYPSVVRYRGCTIERFPELEQDGPSFYVFHPSEAADFGAHMTEARARAGIDRLIRTGALPAPEEAL